MARKLFKCQIGMKIIGVNITIKPAKLFKRLQLPSEPVSIESGVTYHNARTIFSMGAYSYSRSALPINTVVGRYCSIGSNVTALRVDHPLDRLTTSTVTYCKKSHRHDGFDIVQYKPEGNPIVISDDVWIGEGVKIKMGISIGTGAVVGANAIVTKDVSPYAIVAGCPAKLIKYRFEKSVINQLIKSEWWEYDLRKISVPLNENPINIITEIKRANIPKVTYEAVEI